jgi:imidazolonepropionase-like amidohydrolase
MACRRKGAIAKMREASQAHSESTGRAKKAGIEIAVDTDYASGPQAPAGGNALKLELMTAHGFTPMEAILARTKTAAEASG